MAYTVENNIISIVASQIGTSTLSDLSSTTILADVDFDTDKFMSNLGLAAAEIESHEVTTLGDLTSKIESKPDQVHHRLQELATQARIGRLIQVIILFAGQNLPIDEGKRWWNELALQILWWHARKYTEKGLLMVKTGAPARAVQSLTALGLLNVKELAADSTDNAVLFVDTLQRLKYPEDVATKVYSTLSQLALKVVQQHGGKVQRVLRYHGNQMVEAVSADLLSEFENPSSLKEIIQSWVSLTTGLPILVWSPPTKEFVKKFEKFGVSQETLTDVADELELNLIAVDASLSYFVEGVCRGCAIGNDDHQFCVKRFATRNWQVECPAYS